MFILPYLDSNRDARLFVKSFAHHASIPATQHFAILQIRLQNLLISLAGSQIYGALTVDFDMFFGNDYSTSSPTFKTDHT